MRNIPILRLALSAAPLLLACQEGTRQPGTTSREVNAKEKLGEAVDATASAAKAKRDEYAREARERLDQLNGKLVELKERVARAEGQARQELETRLAEAKSRYDAAVERLDQLKDAGTERWEKIKEGVGRALDDLAKAFQ